MGDRVRVVAVGSTEAEGIGLVARLARHRPAVEFQVPETGNHYTRRWPAWLDNVVAVPDPVEAVPGAAAVLVPKPTPRGLQLIAAARDAEVPVIASISTGQALNQVDGDFAGVNLADGADDWLFMLDVLADHFLDLSGAPAEAEAGQEVDEPGERP